MAIPAPAYPSHMVLGRLIVAVIAIVAFIVAWRLLDIFLGVSFGIITWAIKILLLLFLLFLIYRLFTHKHRRPFLR